MIRRTIIILILSAVCARAVGQRRYGPGYIDIRTEVDGSDTTIVVDMLPLPLFSKPADMRKYQKLVYNVKKVYPIARYANHKLLEIEQILQTIPRESDQKKYVERVERELKAEYTPIIRKMTFSQGKILIKLIDRETDHTSYDLVRELRGGFSAFFWQNLGRLFGMNLKDTYDKEGEDRIIEQIILMYEAGLI